jgi:FkbM family methyltransferase
MKDALTRLFLKLLPAGLKYRIEQPLRQKLSDGILSYSQNGEDIILSRIFHGRKTGFFIDIGAHHPIRFSNTYRLYLEGWRGINVDAMPGSMKPFNLLRPFDKNLEIGVAAQEGELTFHIFNEPALNTFSQEEAARKDGKGGYFVQQKVQVKTLPLSKIISEHLPVNTNIDYLNIDAEGLDLEVLKSNDWSKFQPSVISVESNVVGTHVRETEVYKILASLNYDLVSVLFNTLIFCKNGTSAHSVIRI